MFIGNFPLLWSLFLNLFGQDIFRCSKCFLGFCRQRSEFFQPNIVDLFLAQEIFPLDFPSLFIKKNILEDESCLCSMSRRATCLSLEISIALSFSSPSLGSFPNLPSMLPVSFSSVWILLFPVSYVDLESDMLLLICWYFVICTRIYCICMQSQRKKSTCYSCVYSSPNCSAV